MPVTVTAPPPKKTARVTTASGATAPPALPKRVQENAAQILESASMLPAGLIMFRRFADAGALSRELPGLSLETAKLAESNPKVMEFVQKLSTVSPYAGFITIGMRLGMQFMVNAGRIEPSAMPGMGLVSKETLEAQVQAGIAKAEAEAIQLRIDAMNEKAEAERMYAELKAANPDYADQLESMGL